MPAAIAVPLIMAAVSAAGSVASAKIGSDAAKTASGQQVSAEQQGLNFQEQVFQQQQANQQPFLSAGQQSIGQLMAGLQNGQFGAGSLPAVPTAPSTPFTAPTLAEAQSSPGYQFTAQQGTKGILQGAAAAGGAISGGTLRAEDSYNTGLANSTYNDVFNRSLSTYNAGLSGYASQLAGYQTAQGAQQQEFNQLYNTSALGAGSANAINNTGTAVSQNVGNLMGQIGNAQAAGTVGSANALTNGISGATSGISQSVMLSQLMRLLGQGTSPGAVGWGPGTSTALSAAVQPDEDYGAGGVS